MIKPNEGIIDRFVRVFIATALFILAWYWVSGLWRVLAYSAGLIFLGTGILGYCYLYTLIGVNTNKKTMSHARVMSVIGIIIILVTAIGGAWTSDFFTRKFFLEDFARMNGFYKLALFETGQVNREKAIINFDAFEHEYSIFSKSYAAYRPRAIAQDTEFGSNVRQIGEISASTHDLVHSGDLKEAHARLETIRPIFQGILKRNGFSLLAVALVDFHDAMELVITKAEAKDAAGVIQAYAEANEKLKAVEEVANDDAIQTIRRNLETVRQSAERGDIQNLPSQAATMKSSYVKVYLDRG